MFMFDVETMDTESTAVILSLAIVQFEPSEKPTYQELLDKTLFIKLDAKEQIKVFKRSINKDTIEWWAKQHEYARSISVTPSANDVSSLEAVETLKRYINMYPNGSTQAFWARGALDSMAIDSLCRNLDIDPITSYYNWRDVRTAIDLLYGTTNGYCDVDHPEFNRDLVIKHHPSHDVCLDVMMLLYGKEGVK